MKIFFSGIGGSGVSSIAGFMSDKGHRIAGSDRLFDFFPEHRVSRTLREKGITIFPQDGSGIDGSTELAVFSTAVEKDNPDFIKAGRHGVAIRTRPQYLAEIVAGFKTVAVAGTSGKSTIAGMLAFLMQGLGLGPNFIGGGRVKQFMARGNPGNFLTGPSDTLVFEACESDGTIVDYRPSHTIISNLDLDHHSVSETGLMFKRLAENTSGTLVICEDDKNLAACGLESAVGFSIERESRYRASGIEYNRFGSAFTVKGVRFELSLPGAYNVYNALSCIALLSELGIKTEETARVLPLFTGIERRFDVRLDDGRHLVLDDYAHNPHKIESLMSTMKTISRSVCYIFQPHGFGPTKMMKDGYVRAFAGNLRDEDRLVLLPIYYAGGTASKDISSEDLAEAIRAAGRQAVVMNRDEVLSMPFEQDACVVFGARDDSLSDFAGEVAGKLR